jgi:hypothetical protein
MLIMISQAILGDLNPKEMSNFYSYACRVRECTAWDVFSIETTSCNQLLQLEQGLLPLLNSLEIPDDIDLAFRMD